MSDMTDFVRISRYAGMREDLVQAGGGNTSVKLDSRRMAIKASGVQLAEVNGRSGYSVVDYPAVRRAVEALNLSHAQNKGRIELSELQGFSGQEILERALLEGGRPSIETFLHAFTGKFTLHTHSLAINVAAARANGMEQLKECFPSALLIGYQTPGIELARLCERALAEAKITKKGDFSVMVLKNHGVIVSGDTAQEVIDLSESLNEALQVWLGLDLSAYRKSFELYEFFCRAGLDESKLVVKAEHGELLDIFRSFGQKLWRYQFCPDCVVFCGREPFNYDKCNTKEEVRKFAEKYGEPVVLQWGKDLFIRAESVKKAREIESILAFSAKVCFWNRKIQMDYLPEGEQKFLLDWDSEKYRRHI